MKIEESKHSIAELVDLYRRKDLTVNEEYQRAPRLWPAAARSYFIDTILSGFPFPKVYLWEKLNMTTMRPHREIVDGQQRMMSIIDFRDGKYALTSNSAKYEGKRFDDLDDDAKQAFMTYTVSCDVIRNSERNDILQMFRRMNAYTLPLNDAEKRHSEFFGAFKNWVNRLVDRWGPLLSDWKILSSRAIVRMEDAEMIAEFALAMRNGLVSSSSAQLRQLYSDFDEIFPEAHEWESRIDGALTFVREKLSPIQTSYMTKSYAFESLVIALIHARYGIPAVGAQTDIHPIGDFVINLEKATDGIMALAGAHEMKDTKGKYAEYVNACIAGSNRAAQRTARFKMISKALREPA